MQICLNKIRVFARHGVLPDERTLGAWFRVSLCAEADCPQAIENDQLEGTVNYAEMAQIVKEEMSIPSQLLEHVAGRISKRIINEIPLVQSLTIEVEKENPPICLECESSSVKMTVKKG